MIHEKVSICNKLGLHARASIKLVNLAKRYISEIYIKYNNKTINAKRIMEVLLLAASYGTELEFMVQGEDEQEAWSAIHELISNGFYE